MLFVSAEYVLKATLSYKLPLNLDKHEKKKGIKISAYFFQVKSVQ